MDIRWNFFHGRQFQARVATGPRVTLNRHRQFYLNEAAWAALGSPAAVELGTDDSGRIFGMKPCDPHKESAFRVSALSRGRYHRVCAAAFFQNLRMKLDRTVLFQNVDLDNSGVLMLDMNTSVNVGRGAR